MSGVDRSQFRTHSKAWTRFEQALTGPADLTAMGQVAADALLEQFLCEGTSVTRRDGEYLEYVGVSGSLLDLGQRRIRIDQSFTGEVIRRARPRIFHPDGAPIETRVRARVDEVRSGMVAPVVVDGKVVGSVGVVASRGDRFGETALAVLVAFADLLAEAMA